MYELENAVFEHRDELYGKVIDLYVLLLSITVVDIVDKVTNIKQDINTVVIQDIILEKANYYVTTLKHTLAEVYTIFGLDIDPDANLNTFIQVAKVIKDLENTDKDNLVFLDYLLTSDDTTEEKFLKLMDELYPLENNIQYLEDIDISDYFWLNIVTTIYTTKNDIDNEINIGMVNTLTKLLLVDINIKDTDIYRSVLNGSIFVELDINKDIEMIITLIIKTITDLRLVNTNEDMIILEIAVILHLFKNSTDLLFFIKSNKLSNVFQMFSNQQDVSAKLITILSRLEE